jgi:geranylgeranyl reductase family protein
VTWDLVVVGAGPAGSAAAIGALRTHPDLRVLLVDRSAFPRDKACGDGIAPHVLDLLEQYAVTGLADDRVPVHDLRLQRGATAVHRRMRRPAWVIPRAVLDARLRDAALAAGAVPSRMHVRSTRTGPDAVDVVTDDGPLRARVVVGADGAHSVVARSAARTRGCRTRTAFALRGYAPTPPGRAGEQVIVFGDTRQPSYAWSFDRGDGRANVGYGELLGNGRSLPTRRLLLEQLERLLPGATVGGGEWRGHHLPLSTWRWRPAPGRVLLAGDAAGLVNPLTGEGIYYAVLTGLLAGSRAAAALVDGVPDDAGGRYRRAVTPPLRRSLPLTALAAGLTRSDPVLDAGIRAASADQAVFDDLVELGLARGALTPRLVTGLATALARTRAGMGRLPRGTRVP